MKILITEKQLNKIIEQQSSNYTVTATDSPAIAKTSSFDKESERRALSLDFTCVSPELSIAAQYTLSHGIDPLFVKYGLGILGRESDFGAVMGKYGIKAAPEYMMNKMSEVVPGFKNILQWGAKKVFNKDNWVPSMGIAQMTPDIAKKYNVDLEQLMSLSGSLLAASKYLIDLYKQTKTNYDTNSPSKIIINGKLTENPSSSGNAALDAAVMSYNLGASKFKKKYCRTNDSNYMAPCDSPNGKYKPYPNDKPNLILDVKTNDIIKNYIPTIKTDTTGNVDKVLNKFRDKPQTSYISNLGYLKEVVNNVKNFSCIK